MTDLNMWNDYDVLQMTVKFNTHNQLKDNYIEGADLESLTADIKALQI